MMQLPISNLNAWSKVTSGSGTVTISNGGRSAVFTGGVGSGAQVQKNLALSPTGIYKVSFFARRLSGIGNVWIADGATVQNQVQILEGTWERYELTGNVKFNSNSLSSYTRISIGIATADDGSIEVSDVCISEDLSAFGQMKTIASGIVNVESGVCSIGQNYCGISSVAIESTYVIAVTCIPLHASVQTPALFVTPLNPAGTPSLGRVQPTFYDKATGKAQFRFLNYTDNNPVGIASITTAFSFKAETV